MHVIMNFNKTSRKTKIQLWEAKAYLLYIIKAVNVDVAWNGSEMAA